MSAVLTNVGWFSAFAQKQQLVWFSGGCLGNRTGSVKVEGKLWWGIHSLTGQGASGTLREADRLSQNPQDALSGDKVGVEELAC